MRAGVRSDIKIEYYENGGGAVAQLYWSSLSTLRRWFPRVPLSATRRRWFFNRTAASMASSPSRRKTTVSTCLKAAAPWTASSPSGYSGTGALQATPNAGVNVNAGYSASSPRLDFPVNFVKTGTHYVWIRGIGLSGADDSCHVGFDGAELATSDRISGFGTGWTWSKDTMDGVVAAFDVANAGIHTVNVWMREDGLIIDKLLLSVNRATFRSAPDQREFASERRAADHLRHSGPNRD
jgi:hypothetical protein